MYRGLGCALTPLPRQECARGYERDGSERYLGRCVERQLACPPGQYGDPRRGLPCRDCQCPGGPRSQAQSVERELTSCNAGPWVICIYLEMLFFMLHFCVSVVQRKKGISGTALYRRAEKLFWTSNHFPIVPN